jgi:hypothetical protein
MVKTRRHASRKAVRKSRKLNKKASSWNQLVMKKFREGKNKSKAYSLRDAMKAAKAERDRK